MCDAPDLPEPIKRQILADVDPVAIPFIERANNLDSAELRDLIDAGGTRQAAVARRPDLTVALIHQILQHGAPPAIAALLSNASADIDARDCREAIRRHASNPAVARSAAIRSDLSDAAVADLLSQAVDHCASLLVQNCDLPASVIDDIIVRSSDRGLVSLLQALSARQCGLMLEKLVARGRTSPALALRALLSGDRQLCLDVLAACAGMPRAEFRHQMAKGEDSANRLLKQAGIHAAGRRLLRAALNAQPKTAPPHQAGCDTDIMTAVAKVQPGLDPAHPERFMRSAAQLLR
nr:DUF2336 domain-containing protein [Rhodovibrio sodomensis]